MKQITAKVLKRIVTRNVIKMNKVAFVVGQFGAGKTQIIRQAALAAGVVCFHTVLLGQYDTSDLKGLPFEDQATHFLKWCPAETLPFKGNKKFPTEGIILLFLDELTSAQIPVMGVCYQLLNERRVGEHELMDNVRIICAGNRVSDKGIVNRLPEPLKDRVTQFELVIDVDDLCEHGAKMKWPPEILALWQFTEKAPGRKSIICTWDPSNPLPVTATPRSWETAIEYYREMQDDPELMEASIIGEIGEGPCAELFGWVKTWQSLTPISKIIADPMGVPMPVELSARYATALSVSGHLTKKTAKPLMQYLTRLDTDCDMPELYIMAMDMALARDQSLYTSPEYIGYSKRYATVATGR